MIEREMQQEAKKFIFDNNVERAVFQWTTIASGSLL